jgi:glycosyltransferase involved in cell wall biosynthesis
MRVLLLTAAGPWSGVEVHTLSLAEALKAAGHDVAIVELGRNRYGRGPRELPCEVIHVPLGGRDDVEVPLESLGFMAWRRAFALLDGDVAISIKGTYKFASVAMEAAGRLRFPCFLVIEHLHAPLDRRPTMRVFGPRGPSLGLWWYRQSLSGYLRSVFPHQAICVSQAVASTLVDDYGYPRGKVVAAYSGVDTDLFVPSAEARTRVREAWCIPPEAFVFGAVGRLSAMKNHGQLISAFATLSATDQGRDLRLVIAGDGPLRATLEAQAASRGVASRVLFTGFSAEPQAVCQAFDVFCFPSTTGESLGIALLEAMACGCPAIAAAVGGVPEILTDPDAGWLITSGDEGELLAAMRAALARDRAALRQMGTRARDIVVRDFNATERWAAFVRVIERAFEQATGARRG